MSIRIIVVDDEPILRTGLRLLLGAADDIEILAEAGDGAAAIDLVHAHRPDLVLMDIRMPVMNGLEATRRILAEAEPPQILILTAFGTDEFVLEALQAGAAGYVLKDTPPEDIIHAVRAAAKGMRTLSPGAIYSLLGQATGGAAGVTTRGMSDGTAGGPGASGQNTSASGRSADAEWALAQLTEREREIAEAVASGLTNAEVAAKLFVSVTTVKTHLARIFDKLGVRSRTQLAILLGGRLE